jgi:predicted PurR-regulated permease PerM
MVLSVPLTMVVKILLEHTEDLRWLAILLGSVEETDYILAKRTGTAKSTGQ